MISPNASTSSGPTYSPRGSAAGLDGSTGDPGFTLGRIVTSDPVQRPWTHEAVMRAHHKTRSTDLEYGADQRFKRAGIHRPQRAIRGS